jgi:ABC-2 type transport system ATP-binding protein
VNAMVEVDGIVKHYPRRRGQPEVAAVDGVSFHIGRGEIVGLLGPNGAGKTTTIKSICGLVTPDRGRISVCGYDLRRERLHALRHISAVLEGNRNLYWRLTARENLEYFAGNRGRSRRSVRVRVGELLAQFDLAHKSSDPVSRLSRGMQQKLAIAVALLAETDVLLLDEPTLGLDVEAAHEVRDHLRQIAAAGRTLVVSTHDMGVVQDVCDRVVILDHGQIIVDDRVARLMELFETRAYVLTFREALPTLLQERVRDRFPVTTLSAGGEFRLEVCLDRGEDIYTLFDILKEHRTPIEAIDRTTINFERVFLSILRDRQVRVTEDVLQAGTGGRHALV